ncbi:unnamed protein product [Lupinus luteus]|uniref:Uncharacterized protein n=1 Tax=Lupinus luteus TaxID=3873 RepID=A0AAV1WFS1_LUPLU
MVKEDVGEAEGGDGTRVDEDDWENVRDKNSKAVEKLRRSELPWLWNCMSLFVFFYVE